MRPSKRAVVAALAVVMIAGIASLGGVGQSTAAVITPVQVLGGGSDVTFHVMSKLDLLYNESPGCTTIAPTGTQPEDNECIPQTGDVTTENYEHDQISEAFPIGGGAGEDELCKQGLAGEADLSYARQSSISNKCTGLEWVAYARDGITWEAFPGVAGSAVANMHNTSGACAGSTGLCLTQAQLQGIYVNCTITNWNQVGGANQKIIIYSILPQFGTRKAFDTFLGGSSSSCPNVKLVAQTDNSEVAAADKPGAIVPVDSASWTERYGSKPGADALGQIDQVSPSLKNVQSGAFPYSRYLYNVYCAGDPANSNKCGTTSPSSAAVINYIGPSGFLCKKNPTLDPITKATYRSEIVKALNNYGFASIPLGATGGGQTGSSYCRLFP
jgi:ABC-type phosphate transport system substrate-binding protein